MLERLTRELITLKQTYIYYKKKNMSTDREKGRGNKKE
jgi:hypothetical protein